MPITISTHNGHKIAREHNVRNRKVTNKEEHIDPNGIYEIWIDEKIRQAYERLFGKAQQEYNDRQQRADRKIDNYYNQIAKDSKKHVAYEMVIGVYGKDENGNPICAAETGKAIMKEFVDNWRERNPSLELVGAYYHADEDGEPHVHIDYIPVAHGYSRGMETQTGLVKALGEQGFIKQGKATAQILWEKRENEYLESICNKYGLEVSHPKAQKQHLDTKEYKELQQQLQDKAKELQAVEKQLDQLDGKAKVEVLTKYLDSIQKRPTLTPQPTLPQNATLKQKIQHDTITMPSWQKQHKQELADVARWDEEHKLVDRLKQHEMDMLETKQTYEQKLKALEEKESSLDMYSYELDERESSLDSRARHIKEEVERKVKEKLEKSREYLEIMRVSERYNAEYQSAFGRPYEEEEIENEVTQEEYELHGRKVRTSQNKLKGNQVER